MPPVVWMILPWVFVPFALLPERPAIVLWLLVNALALGLVDARRDD